MIILKSKEEIQIMREGGRMLSAILQELSKMVKPGILDTEIEETCAKLLLQNGLRSNFKGYGGFPNVTCISINDVVVHGIATGRVIKDGDLVSIDCGAIYKGYNTDMAISLVAGKNDFEAQRLCNAARQALAIGIKTAVPGNTFGDIGYEIQKYVEAQGFSVVRDLCGHGIGKELHEDPQILNYGKRGTGSVIKEGMVFCIEPMITNGDWEIKKGEDGFAYKTADGSLASHFEHMVAITENGPEALTYS